MKDDNSLNETMEEYKNVAWYECDAIMFFVELPKIIYFQIRVWLHNLTWWFLGIPIITKMAIGLVSLYLKYKKRKEA